MEGKLGELNQRLRKAKSDGTWSRKILFQINQEKARLIRDKTDLDTINTIEGVSIVSFISTNYRRIDGMSDMITQLAKSMSNGEPDYQSQLESEGYIGLTKAMTKWDEEADNDAKWSTYAYPFIKNAMVDYTRKNERWERLEYRDDIEEAIAPNQRNPEQIFLYREKMEMAMFVMLDLVPILNEREGFVLYNIILADEPMSYREVGEQFNCSKDSIMRDIMRVSANIKEKL